MSLLIAPMVVPIVVVGVSTYLFFAKIGLTDTYIGLVLVHAALGARFVLTQWQARRRSRCRVRCQPALGAKLKKPVRLTFRFCL